MAKNVALIFILATFISCKTELVKWEYISEAGIYEQGNFENNGLILHKTISKQDVASKLKLNGSEELKSVKILTASAEALIDQTTTADSVSYELFCDAIPLVPTHKGVAKIKKGALDFKLPQSVKLLGVNLETAVLLNNALDGVINNKKTVKFSLIARAIPSGTKLIGTANLKINLETKVWKCVEKPEITVFSDENKGPCN